ncbi:hypothetical protein MANES_11G066950v8 [Manihot esculenta]|uniref:Uncharacterized protein n=1 Tax=Manihot esculenta TaxID=3983 RepID=A0ACB7GV53_MANES|nr:hypothetical protein MANES_11G066950v8 [Manihot esculenta]
MLYFGTAPIRVLHFCRPMSDLCYAAFFALNFLLSYLCSTVTLFDPDLFMVHESMAWGLCDGACVGQSVWIESFCFLVLFGFLGF